MNLRDVSDLIAECESVGDTELAAYYKEKRRELIAILNRDIVKHLSTPQQRYQASWSSENAE
jgi:hypothetical protein